MSALNSTPALRGEGFHIDRCALKRRSSLLQSLVIATWHSESSVANMVVLVLQALTY